MEFFDYQLMKINDEIIITVRSIILIFAGYVLARLVQSLVRRVLRAYFNRRGIDIGRSYTIITLVKYVIYVLSFFIILQLVGIKMNYVLAGSAALLVGVGIGLQNTFNDFFSGIILLVDGTIEVGDVLSLQNTRAKVKYIGIRTSKLENIDNPVPILAVSFNT